MAAALFTLLLVNSALAYTVPSDTVVYVTPTGSCYHREDCSYIKNSCRALSISSAEGQGYRACSRCDPDVLTGQYESDWDGSGGGDGGGTIGTVDDEQRAEDKPFWQKAVTLVWVIAWILLGPWVAALLFSAVVYPIKWLLERKRRE